jgi:hypothetical protein
VLKRLAGTESGQDKSSQKSDWHSIVQIFKNIVKFLIIYWTV